MPTEQPPFVFPPDLDYPVSLAIFHSVHNGSDTPVSGDLKGMSWQDRKAMRELEIQDWLEH